VATRNFNVKNGLTAGNITLDATTNTTTTANLVVTGNANLTAAANVALGSNSNVKLTGGSAGQYLQTDGAGNLSWQTVSGATSIANGTSNVRIPTANGNVVVSVNGAANIATFTSNAVFRGSYGLTGAIFQANTAPASPQPGDQWYNTFNGILFEYIDDGTSLQWVDISTLAFPNITTANANAILNNVQTTGTYYPTFISSTANGYYSLNSNTAYVANVANGHFAATLLGGTLTTAAQPNITSVGTLTSLTVSGNITPTANITYDLGNNTNRFRDIYLANSTIYIGSQTINANATSVIISGNLVANVTGNITGSFANGNSNVNIPAANGNVNITAAGNANILVVTGTGVNVAGTLNASGNANVGNIGATRGVFTNVSGEGGNLSNIQGGNVSGAVASATAATNASALLQNTSTATTVYPTFTTSSANGNSSAVINTGISANLGNASITATTFVGALSGAATSATSATNAAALLQNTSTATTVYPTFTTSSANGNSSAVINTGISANLGNASITATTFVGALSGAATSATTAGTVTTAAQPNITSVGTLTSLGVNGTVTAVAFTANTGVFTGNGNGISSLQAANVTGTLPTSVTNAISNVGTITAGTWNSTFTAGLNANTLANIQGANVSGTVASATAATNAAALLQNTSTATTVYPTFTTSSANGNSSAVINTGISANLGNSSITATTFVGALSGAATTAGTVTTAAQPNITSTGTLTSLTVSGNATAGNLIGPHANGNSNINMPAANGNVNISVAGNANVLVVTGTGVNVAGTLNTGTGVITGNGSGLSAIAGANVTGTVSSATTAGTVTTAAQPNITSVGTLTSLGVTGNVAAGNLTTTGVLSVTGTGVSSIAGNLDMTSNTIINLATPTNPTDAATKQYVDDVAQGLNIHDAVAAATPTTLATITGGTITYNNGSSGVGANLVTTGTFNLIDGVNVQTAGTRILVRSEANAVHNGIYTWSNATVITRATDYDSVPEVEAGDFVFVTGGTLYDNTGWVQTDTVTAIGTAGNNINFTQFSGAGTYNAGTGLTLTGSTFSVNASQTQITSVGTLGSLTVTGNASAGNLNTAGAVVASTLTSNVAAGTAPLTVTSTTLVPNLYVARANVADFISASAGTGNNFLVFANAATGNVSELTSTGLTANLSNNSITATTFVGALSGAATTAGTVTTNAQPNITSVGTLTSLGVNGTVTAVAFTANTGVFTGNGNGLSSLQASNVTGTLPTSVTNAISNVGTITAGTWNSTFTAGLNANTLANIQGANVSGTVASATAATNASALLQNTSTATTVYPTFTTSSANGNSAAVFNTGISANLGNASITATTFVGALSGAATSATTAGTVTTAAQPNITSVGTLTSLGVSGAVTASTLVSNVVTGTAPLTVTSTTRVANLNVANSGFADAATNAAALLQNTSTATTVYPTFTTSSANGNSQAVFNTGISANLGNASITATTFVGALSGAATSATTAGTVTTAAQPNITSTGTLSSLTVSGKASLTSTSNALEIGGYTQIGGASSSVGIKFTGGGTLFGLAMQPATDGTNMMTFFNAANTAVGSITQTAANVTWNGLVTGSNVTGTVASATTAGTVTTAAQPNITSTGTLTSLTTSGNLTFNSTGQRILGDFSNATVNSRVAFQSSALNTNTVVHAIPNGTGTVAAFSVESDPAITNGQFGQYAVIANTDVRFISSVRGTGSFVPLTFYAGNSERMRVDTNGNVGIGNTAPTHRLSVTGTTSLVGNVTIQSNVSYVSPNGSNTITERMANGGTLSWNGNAGQLFSIVDSMTGNIFTVNDVSGVPLISVDSGGNIQLAASGGFVSFGVTTGAAGAGSTQGTATALTRPITVVSTVSNGANGVILPTVPAGTRIIIVNTSANALNVYPPSGAVVNSGSTNASYSQPAGARLEYFSTSSTQWYTLNATYG